MEKKLNLDLRYHWGLFVIECKKCGEKEKIELLVDVSGISDLEYKDIPTELFTWDGEEMYKCKKCGNSVSGSEEPIED